MQRKPFDTEELRAAGAIDVGRPVNKSDLETPILSLFRGWDETVSTATFDLLYPSIQLASNLIRVGTPYISSFLPSHEKQFWGGQNNGDQWPSEIPLNPNPSATEISEAEKDLERLAEDLTWNVDPEMFLEAQFLGVTRQVESDEPWVPLDHDTVQESDDAHKSNGLKYRPLTIYIMEEYVTALKESDPKSERHLRATFMAAITMVHEFGHAIFQNDFRAFHPTREPHVGDHCEAELGVSFITWIFSGYHPRMSSPEDVGFQEALCWETHYTTSISKRRPYRTYYSIPMSYMERVLSQQFWAKFSDLKQPEFSAKARIGLRPNTNVEGGQVATGVKPEWTYSHLKQRPVWIPRNNFRLAGFKITDEVPGLTKEEIAYERDLTKNDPENLKYATMIKEERERPLGINQPTLEGDGPDVNDSNSGPSEANHPRTEPPSEGPTVQEMFEDAMERARDLNALGQSRARLRTKSQKPPISGLAMLEDVEDYEADEEDVGGGGDGDDEMDYEMHEPGLRDLENELNREERAARQVALGFRPAMGPSHMDDIYDQINPSDDWKRR